MQAPPQRLGYTEKGETMKKKELKQLEKICEREWALLMDLSEKEGPLGESTCIQRSAALVCTEILETLTGDYWFYSKSKNKMRRGRATSRNYK